MIAPGALTVRLLAPDTWPAFAEMVEDQKIWGGCWCVGFHGRELFGGDQRATKERMVREGRTHAALVFEDATCVGWAQYGSPAELPAIKNRAAYEASLGALPDWRLACLYVRKGHRHRGVAETAVRGALDAIARAGGGMVEAYPEEVEGRKVSGSFLWNGTLAMYERLGFVRDRRIGKHKWVVRRAIARLEVGA